MILSCFRLIIKWRTAAKEEIAEDETAEEEVENEKKITFCSWKKSSVTWQWADNKWFSKNYRKRTKKVFRSSCS